MSRLTLKDLKNFINEIPDEFDSHEIGWVDFAGYNELSAKVYDDGIIICNDTQKLVDRRGSNWL